MTNEQDTRKKLERDLIEFVKEVWQRGRRFEMNEKPDEWDSDKLMMFLDRQAAITERECLKAKSDELRECDEQRLEFRDQRDYLQAKVDELSGRLEDHIANGDRLFNALIDTTAERDDYKASMETLEANANLWREQADKLKAENKRLSDRVNGLLLELLIIAEKLGAENVSDKTA